MSRILVVVLSTLVWPAVQLALFWLRFQRMPPGGASEAFIFVPMGLAAGIVAFLLMGAAATMRQRRAVVWGYLAACPFALAGSLLAGLVLPGVWGPLLVGGVALSTGCLVGFVIGRQREAGTA